VTSAFELSCHICHEAVEATVRPDCSHGHGAVTFSYAATTLEVVANESPMPASMWRYRDLMPVTGQAAEVSLGEGFTPLVDAPHMAAWAGLDGLTIKPEAANPTGSFKDRCASVAMTKAREFGVTGVAIASAGNAGAAAAAYAARASIPCWVVVPRGTPVERLTQITIMGAHLVPIDGTVNDCVDVVRAMRDDLGLYPVTTAVSENPYQGEGPRSLAFEIHEQFGDVPDWIVAPVGGGGLLSAIARGWRDLYQRGLIASMPRLAAVQPTGCAPLVRAWETAADPFAIRTWGPPTSIASSIADPYPLDGWSALISLRSSGGAAIAVDDDEIRQAERLLAECEGLFVEPASACALAGVRALTRSGVIEPSARVVVIATGAGFKDLGVAAGLTSERETVDPLETEIASLVSRVTSGRAGDAARPLGGARP
jgi:threonine synthase